MREFRAYIEKDWDTAAINKNDQQSKARLNKKHKGLQFNYDNDGIIYTINPSDIEGEKGRNGVWMAIYKPPMWEENKNPDTRLPWKFTEDLIYLIKNTPKDDDFVLKKIDEPSTNEYDDNEEPKGDNTEDA